MRQSAVVLSMLVVVAGLLGCGSDLHVSTIQLGRSLNADNTVANHTTVFAPNETVYVAIVTAGSGKGTVGVRWMYEGRVMGEPKKPVSSRDGVATEFHLQSTGEFPTGDYTVEVFFNGQSAGSRPFKVVKP
jgi:hypothetical protein